jgi:hypothetical protein
MKGLLSMADELIKEKKGHQELVNMHLSEENSLLSFKMLNEMVGYDGITEFQDGQNVLVRRQKTFDDDIIHLSCSMVKGAEFPLHFHDFFEYFVMLKGRIREIKTGKVLEGGDYHSLLKGSYHGFISEEDSLFEIICSKHSLSRKKINLLII